MNINSILERFKEQTGHVGFYFENLITGEKAGYKADEAFLAASVIKLPILMCIAKWEKEGKADFNEKILVKQEDKLPICGALTLFTNEPVVDVLTLCRLMISISDNTATNLLIKRFGIEKYQEEFINLGLKETKLNRMLFDAEKGAQGIENFISPIEIANLLKLIYQRSFIDEETSKLIEDIMLLQQINHKIPGIIADGVVSIAHKTGEDDFISNDVGIVYAKQPFIVCFAGHNTNVGNFEYLIRNVSFEIFAELNN